MLFQNKPARRGRARSGAGGKTVQREFRRAEDAGVIAQPGQQKLGPAAGVKGIGAEGGLGLGAQKLAGLGKAPAQNDGRRVQRAGRHGKPPAKHPAAFGQNRPGGFVAAAGKLANLPGVKRPKPRPAGHAA